MKHVQTFAQAPFAHWKKLHGAGWALGPQIAARRPPPLWFFAAALLEFSAGRALRAQIAPGRPPPLWFFAAALLASLRGQGRGPARPWTLSRL